MRSLDDVKAWFAQPCTGTAETGAAPWWRLLKQVTPEVRVATIRRPVAEVMDSLKRVGTPINEAILQRGLQRLDAKLDQIEHRIPGVMSIRFHDLPDEATCARLFEFCLPYQHDHAWWQLISSVNIQTNLPALSRYEVAYAPQMARFAAMARQTALAALARRRVVDINGITIRQEPFDGFYRDGVSLFGDHLVKVGEAPDAPKNVELVRLLDQMGAIQVTTARGNGRMFGYIISLLGPSLEEPGVMSALTLTFYASPDIPGLGLRMHRASNEALRERGIGEVLYQVGHYPRLGALYRRLGAVSCGENYLLRLH